APANPSGTAPAVGSGQVKPPESSKVEAPKPGEGADPVINITAEGEKIYERLLKSAVVIFVLKGNGMAMGSGSLVDKENKLVLTNHHVAGDGDNTIRLFFPEFKNGQLVSPRKEYTNRLEKGEGIPGWVVAKHPKKDL